MQEQLASALSPDATRPASPVVSRPRLRQWLLGLAALSGIGVLATPAHAVPAFARQTGQACIACHIGGFGPQLTPFGRAFKLGGYTLSNGKSHIPLSAMLVSSFTHTTNDIQANTDYNGEHSNDNFVALQQASIFLAGRLTSHVGVLAQATYEQATGTPHFGWDNSDLRYAHNYSFGAVNGIFGITLNNNPTVTDVWNTAPAWQYGFMSQPIGAVGGYVTPVIMNLGEAVLGTTAYTLVNDHWYVEAGLYHRLSAWTSQQLNAAAPDEISGYAPYWRVNYSTTKGNANYEVGLVGMNVKAPADSPDFNISGGADKYNDVGIDGSYQYLNGDTQSVTVNGMFMREKQDYGATGGNNANSSNTLNYANVNTAYWYDNTYGATIQFFNVTGSSDALLYSGANGYFNNNPNSSGVVWELDWNPFGKNWADPEKNLRLGLQYTTFNKYNGSSADASGQNSLYFYLWTAI